MTRRTDILQLRFEVDGHGRVKPILADTAQGLENIEQQGRRTNAMWGEMRTMLAGLGFAAATREIVRTGLQLEKIEATLKAGVGSSLRARQEMEFLRNETDRLGLVFLTTAERVAGFYAASRGTEVADDVREITTAFLEASAVYRLTQEQVEGVFRAVEQMVSKGRVSAEELRGQLGERLYGAFILAAEAIGVTSEELDNMLERGELAADDLLPRLAAKLREVVAPEIGEAANSNFAAFNRFQNTLDETEAQLAEGGLLDALGLLASTMGDIITNTIGATKELGEFGAKVSVLAARNPEDAAMAGLFLNPLTAAFGAMHFMGRPDPTTRAGQAQLSLEEVRERLSDRQGDLRNLESFASQPTSIMARISGQLDERRKAIREDIAMLEEEQARLEALVKNIGAEDPLEYGVYTGDRVIRESDPDFVGPPSRLAGKPLDPIDTDGVDTTALDREMKEIEARLLALSGSAFDSAAITIELKYEELLEKLKKAGRDTSLVEDLIDVEKATARFDILRDQARDVLDLLSQDVQRVQAQVNAGLLSEAEGRQQILELQRETAAVLEAELLPRLREQAELLGPDAQRAVEQMVSDLQRLKQTANPVLTELRAGLEGAFSNFVHSALMDIRTVSDAFEALGDSILDTVNRIIADRAAQALVSWITSLFTVGDVNTGASGFSSDGSGMGPPSSLAGTNHTGGIAGVADAGSRMVPTALFAGAPRFHIGGIIGSDEVPIIAKRGEGVFTPEQMAALSPASSEVNIEVHNYSDQQARVEQSRSPDGKALVRIIVGEIAGDIRRGGDVGRAIESTYGASRVGRR